MLKLTKLADYASLVMNCLANAQGELMSSAAIAEYTGLPPATVSKVLKKLTISNLVLSKQGGQGGYLLHRDATDISLIDLIDAIEGRWKFVECHRCKQTQLCHLQHNWQQIDSMIRNMLGKISIADMGKPSLPFAELTEKRGLYDF